MVRFAHPRRGSVNVEVRSNQGGVEVLMLWSGHTREEWKC